MPFLVEQNRLVRDPRLEKLCDVIEELVNAIDTYFGKLREIHGEELEKAETILGDEEADFEKKKEALKKKKDALIGEVAKILKEDAEHHAFKGQQFTIEDYSSGKIIDTRRLPKEDEALSIARELVETRDTKHYGVGAELYRIFGPLVLEEFVSVVVKHNLDPKEKEYERLKRLLDEKIASGPSNVETRSQFDNAVNSLKERVEETKKDRDYWDSRQKGKPRWNDLLNELLSVTFSNTLGFLNIEMDKISKKEEDMFRKKQEEAKVADVDKTLILIPNSDNVLIVKDDKVPEPHQVEIGTDEVILGREPDCDIVLRAQAFNLELKQAKIIYTKEGFKLTSLKGAGAELNGKRIGSNEYVLLKDGQTLKISEDVFEFTIRIQSGKTPWTTQYFVLQAAKDRDVEEKRGGSAEEWLGTLGFTGKTTSDVTFAEVKAAYRKLALKYHPDRNKGDASAASKMVEIASAYTQLKELHDKNPGSFKSPGVGLAR